MNDQATRSTHDPGEEQLDRAIRAVLSSAGPADAQQRLVETAANWDPAAVVLPATNRRWRIVWLAATSAAALVLAVGMWFWLSRPENRPDPVDQQQVNQRQEGDAVAVVPGNKGLPAPQTFHEPVPMTSPVMADSAPILACIGPEQPIKLGAVVPHADINKGFDANVVRLHVWDWSRSDVSRVLLIQRSELGILSPDGTTMLTSEGETLNLASKETRQYPGFSVPEGQRISAVRLSPKGTKAALMIHVQTRIEQVQANPQLSGATHQWSLRLLDLKPEKRLGDFPAQAAAGVAFSPDESSLLYSNDQHVIIRRDLASGEILNEYKPAVGSHGAVGIAVSPDGRLVAVGHYHGKLFMWEVSSGKLVGKHQFVRDNGDVDTFFQAKVMRFSPDSELLAIASGNRLKVVEAKTGKVLKQHYHETTPAFAHLQWSPDAKQVSLLTWSEPTDYADEQRIPPRPTADILPRVYEWEWRSGEPRLKEFR